MHSSKHQSSAPPGISYSFLLEYGCFTVLSWFLCTMQWVGSTYTYISPCPPPSHLAGSPPSAELSFLHCRAGSHWLSAHMWQCATSIPTSQSIPRHLPAPGPPIHPLPASLFLPCKRVHLRAHCSTIYNSQDTKANSHWQMNGQKRRYTWNLTQPLKRNSTGSFVDWANLEPENPICFHKERSSVVDLNYGSGFLIDITPAQVPMSPLSSPSPKPCPSISLSFFLITAS